MNKTTYRVASLVFAFMAVSTATALMLSRPGIIPHPWSENKEEVSVTVIEKEKVTPNPFPIKVKAPDLVGVENWINSAPINSLEDLKGKVVLIDFWTYSCINCIRTLDHIQGLHEDYADDGLVVIGVHAPEFQYERIAQNVKDAVIKYGLTYPVVQDNDFKTWKAYKNRYWPAQYLIDKDGFVRYFHFGEGQYKETEEAIVTLLNLPKTDHEDSI